MAIDKVISELNRRCKGGVIVEYAIGGGIAAPFYIEVTATDDVDVFVGSRAASSHPLAPLSPIYADLIPRGAKQDGQYLVIGDWPVKFLTADDPL